MKFDNLTINGRNVPVTPGRGIEMRFIGPTNTKPARIRFSWFGGPSDTFRKINKTISKPLEPKEREELAAIGVGLYLEWLNAEMVEVGLTGDTVAKAIRLAYMDGETDWIILETEMQRDIDDRESRSND